MIKYQRLPAVETELKRVKIYIRNGRGCLKISDGVNEMSFPSKHEHGNSCRLIELNLGWKMRKTS